MKHPSLGGCPQSLDPEPLSVSLELRNLSLLASFVALVSQNLQLGPSLKELPLS